MFGLPISKVRLQTKLGMRGANQYIRLRCRWQTKLRMYTARLSHAGVYFTGIGGIKVQRRHPPAALPTKTSEVASGMSVKGKWSTGGHKLSDMRNRRVACYLGFDDTVQLFEWAASESCVPSIIACSTEQLVLHWHAPERHAIPVWSRSLYV